VRSKTVTITLPAPRDDVFHYLADIHNLPDWATEFARQLKNVDGRHKVVNNLGEFFFEIDADPKTGVIDMYAGPTPDHLAIFPSRVIDLPTGDSAFSFTMFQAPGMPDELFESQHRSLVREFDNISRRFGGSTAPAR
jgi:hypothetical protein